MSERRKRGDYHENIYANVLAAHLPTGALWVDLGAGSRVHGGWLAPTQDELVGRARLLIGVDAHPAGLRKNRFLGARLLADADALPLPDSSVQLVTANMVVEHLANPARVFGEVARVLAPGACFVFSTPNRAHPPILASSVLAARPWRRNMARVLERRAAGEIFPTYYRANTERTINGFAQTVGLEVLEIRLFNSIGLLRHVPVLRTAEAVLFRMTAHERLRRFRSNIVACLRRGPEPDPHRGVTSL